MEKIWEVVQGFFVNEEEEWVLESYNEPEEEELEKIAKRYDN